MVNLVVSLVTVLVLLVVALLALGAVTLVPLVLTLGRAEREDLGTTRWGAVSVTASVVGLALALLVVRGLGAVPTWVAVLPFAATWLGPLLVRRAGGTRVAGARGRHA